MLRIWVVIGFLLALITGASAAPWDGMSSGAISETTIVEKAACGHDDFYCPYGRYRACAPNGQCWCNRCGQRYWNDPNYNYQPGPPGMMFNFGVGGGGPAPRTGYQQPSRRWNTWNGCPPNYTVQDGVCKPYTGR